MTGHAGDGVVQNNHSGIALVIGNVCKAGHAGVHKGGVTDDGNRLSLALLAQRLVKAVNGADRSTHTKCHIHRTQRSNCTQGITADITQNSHLILLQCIEQTSMRTSGAHHGRSHRQGLIQLAVGGSLPLQLLRDHILGVLSLHGEHVLTGDLKSKSLTVVLDNRIQFLHDGNLLHLGSKIQDQLLGQRIDHAKL